MLVEPADDAVGISFGGIGGDADRDEQSGEDRLGREIDVDHEYIVFECGSEVVDGTARLVCEAGPGKLVS